MADNGSWPVETGTLYGFGALSWSQITGMLGGFRGVWGDVDGMHLAEPLPSEAPAYTHVWAWRDDLCARVRLDLPSDRHILGMLVLGGQPPQDAQPVTAPEPVSVTVLPVRGWGELKRVAALPAGLRNPALDRLVTRQPEPVTFVRAAAGA